MKQADYIRAISTGDAAALKHLYAEQLPVIRSLIRRYGNSSIEAGDLFYKAVSVVYQKVQAPDFQLTSQFGTYFYSICRNLLLNQMTKKSSRVEVALSEDVKYIPEDTSVEEELLRVERGSLVRRAFARLGEDCRRVLELYFQKIPMETIAAQMGFGSEGYARRRKHQCQERLIELARKDPAFRELIE